MTYQILLMRKQNRIEKNKQHVCALLYMGSIENKALFILLSLVHSYICIYIYIPSWYVYVGRGRLTWVPGSRSRALRLAIHEPQEAHLRHPI